MEVSCTSLRTNADWLRIMPKRLPQPLKILSWMTTLLRRLDEVRIGPKRAILKPRSQAFGGNAKTESSSS
jgi:hypothetical protein